MFNACRRHYIVCISEIIGIEKKGYLTLGLTVTFEPPKKCHDKSHFFNSTVDLENLLLQPLYFDFQHTESCLKCLNLHIHIYFLSRTSRKMHKCLGDENNLKWQFPNVQKTYFSPRPSIWANAGGSATRPELGNTFRHIVECRFLILANSVQLF